jgi:ABC-2 type transport system ATP-binding protein
MSGDAVLVAHELRKRFGSVDAVAGVSLRVAPGERVGLLGPNGAGKTTTLLMLLGAILPDAGTVTIAGRRLPAERSAAMAHIGFAAGYLPLPDALKVREALDYFAALSGVRRRRAAVDAALERFRIPHLAERTCRELSSGQRTLVGLVKALLHRPDLLVLDEPTASLDPDVAARVRSGLLEACEADGTALLVTSHDMREVTQLCRRVVFLAGGRVVADDSPAALVDAFGADDLDGVFLTVAGRSLHDSEVL